MMKTKWLMLGLGLSSILALSGCGKNPQQANAGLNGQPSGINPVASNGTQAYGLKSQASFQTDASGMRINPMTAPANQSYYFAFNSSAMRPKDLAALKIQANYLAVHPNAKVKLGGNTDDRGSREYNIGLGWRRDQSVASIMEQLGVKASQIEMVSYGKERPVALGNNPQAWALNRRVDLTYKAY